MKKLLLLIIGLFFSMVLLQAQNERIYIMKDGSIVDYHEYANVDSIIFYEPVFGGSFTDARDGNVYQYTIIGNQIWMAENLKYLPFVVDASIASYEIPYYYVYGYVGNVVSEAKETDNYQNYGVLYNWSAAMQGEPGSDLNPSGVQGACPEGWHLPSNQEWYQLFTYVGGMLNAAAVLKEEGDDHWEEISGFHPATNEYGFTALPGGFVNGSAGVYGAIGLTGEFRSTNHIDGYRAYSWIMYNNNDKVYDSSPGHDSGISVRCVKD